jgi:3',5'-cyclic AMP phosphodiesterase CpdA
VLVLAVDSNVRGEFFGRLHPDSIAWIRDQLDATDRDRAILAMHQPPAQLGHPIVDQLRLLDAEALEDVVANSPSVIATLCGHTHAAISTTFGGKPLLVAPGVHSWGQVPLEFTEPNAGLIKEDSPPGFAVHLIDGRRVVTYFEVCPERR